VCLDFGGVLTTRADLSVTLPTGSAAPTDPAAFRAAYWDERDAYDRGTSDSDYWARVLTAGGGQVTPASVAAASARDASAWLELEPASRALLDELAAVGADLALLSNAPHAVAGAIRATDWAGAFTDLVFSCETGVLKPDVGAYRAVPDPGTGVLFFDDRQANADGAIAAGWAGHLWTGVDAARPVLRAAGFPVRPPAGGDPA